MTTFNILLGFDFGLKRIGLAIGQFVTKTARPLCVIKAKNGVPDWQALDKLMRQWKPDALVVGIPLNMDGTEQPITKKTKDFINALKSHYDLPVFEMDERLTTASAREQLFSEGGYQSLQHGQVDTVAAQLILQNWIAQETRTHHDIE